MSKMNSLLTERLKPSNDKASKMADLAQMASSGGLSSFAGLFKIKKKKKKEQVFLKTILEEYKQEDHDIEQDFQQLSSLTSEVKAINNQAAILHGERIKKAQNILKRYKEGAFTFWMIQTYGNRQTPYNFLQYFELYEMLPKPLLVQLDLMPRQAAYTLASRSAPLEQKEEFIKNYQGETKDVLLDQIRKAFPLAQKDKRAKNNATTLLKSLEKIAFFFRENTVSLSSTEEKKALSLLKTIHSHICKQDFLS